VGSMARRRWNHTATVLPDGRVLVAGGRSESGGPIQSAEIYEPVDGTFSETGSLFAARNNHTATLLGCGAVLVAGGGIGVTRSSAELYDLQAGVWTPTADMGTARVGHAAVLLLNGQVLVVGGTAEVSAERFVGGCPPCPE